MRPPPRVAIRRPFDGFGRSPKYTAAVDDVLDTCMDITLTYYTSDVLFWKYLDLRDPLVQTPRCLLDLDVLLSVMVGRNC